MKWVKLILLLILVINSYGVGGEAAESKATVIDRDGNRFDVTNFKYEGQGAFPVMVGDKRTMVKLKEIKQIEFKGDSNEETQPVLITFFDGRTLQGEVFAGGSGRIVGSGGSVSAQVAFTGNTALGKFRLSLRRVKDVIFRPVETAMTCPADGKVFEQEGYKFCPYDGTPLEPAQNDTLREDGSVIHKNKK